jgi:hypothetical protein
MISAFGQMERSSRLAFATTLATTAADHAEHPGERSVFVLSLLEHGLLAQPVGPQFIDRAGAGWSMATVRTIRLMRLPPNIRNHARHDRTTANTQN